MRIVPVQVFKKVIDNEETGDYHMELVEEFTREKPDIEPSIEQRLEALESKVNTMEAKP